MNYAALLKFLADNPDKDCRAAVSAYANAQWPKAMSSDVAGEIKALSAMAQLEASDPDAAIHARESVLREAREHADACLDAADGWSVETLGFNIESAFGDDLSPDECDDIAESAIAARTTAPLSDRKRMELAREHRKNPPEWDTPTAHFQAGIDAAEKAHGITAKGAANVAK